MPVMSAGYADQGKGARQVARRGKEPRVGMRFERWVVALQLRQMDVLARLEERLAGRALGGAEDGQSTVEYAVVAAVIVVAAIAAMNTFGGGVGQVFARLVGRLQGVG